MSVKYSGQNVLTYIFTLIKNKFVEKETGKGLSTNDYTTAEKTKLSGIATGAEVNVNADWNSSSGDSQILNKPTLSTVATSGSYSDLSNKPTIPSVPAISTSITTDASSNVKTASPKAVKDYVDSRVSTTYKPAGSTVFASLPTLSASILGNVYNVNDSFTTTSNFVEGAGKSYPAGSNVVVVDTGSSVYKYDVLSGFIDLSGYVESSDMIEYTNNEVQSIWDGVFSS